MKSSRKQISGLLTRLRVRYGPTKTDPGLWGAMVIEYTEELTRYTPEVLGPAMRQAWKASPTWFPGLGLIVECCEAEKRAQVIPESHQLEENTPDHQEAKRRVRAIIDNLADEMET